MPIYEKDDFVLNYEVDGANDAPVLILSNSLGTELAMWEPQVALLAQHFRVLRYDSRGHGESDVTPGPYSIAQLGDDVIALMDHLDIQAAYFCGLSMGGMVGMCLAIHHPKRIKRLVLANSAGQIGTAQSWNNRIETVNSAGMPAIIPNILNRWFTEDFQRSSPATVQKIKTMLLRTTTTGYTACCGAVRDCDLRALLSGIQAPTLVIGATHDQSTPPQGCREVAAAIAGAAYVELDAAHMSNLQQPDAFNQALLDFLTASH